MTRADDEFRRFAHARFKPMVRAAVLLGCSPVEAEDAAQDALVRCFVAWRRVSTADDPGAYAYRVLVNGIRRGRRRRWRGELPHAVLPEGPPEADPGDGVSLGLTVRAALARLPAGQRDVVVLRYFADLSETATSQALHVSKGTVKSRASRALAALSHDPALASLAAPRTQGTQDTQDTQEDR
jgi:RNA polymerase sigma-70 factor (sigma-E family)